MLALADHNGEVQASIPGLARLAGVSIEATEVALERFLRPDPYSRSSVEEGRRIQPIEGGWWLINHKAYRDKATGEDRAEKNRERQRRFKASHPKDNAKALPSVTKALPKRKGNAKVTPFCQSETESESDAESEAEKTVQGNTQEVSIVESPQAIATTHRLFAYWQSVMNHPTAKLTPKRARKVQDRLAQGYTEETIRAAIDGCKASAFHQGQSEKSDGRVYDDLELICRDGEHLEQFTNQQRGNDGTLVRRNGARRESTAERRWRETQEYCEALKVDAIDSDRADVPRFLTDGN